MKLDTMGSSELQLYVDQYINLEKQQDLKMDFDCISEKVLQETINDMCDDENGAVVATSSPRVFRSRKSANSVNSIFAGNYPKRIRFESVYRFKDVSVAVMGDSVIAITQAMQSDIDPKTRDGILFDVCSQLQSCIDQFCKEIEEFDD